MKRLGDFVSRDMARHAAVRLGGGTAIAHALVVATAPIITRLYTPAELGQYGLTLSFVGFASVGLSLRYDMAIVPAESDDEAARLLVLATVVTVPMVLIASGLLLVLISRNVLSFGTLSASAAIIVSMLLLVTGAFGAVRYWAIRNQDFTTIARASVVQGAGRALLPVAAGLLGAGWLGLILGELVGRALGIGELMRVAFARMQRSIQSSTSTSLWQCAAKYWRYPLIVAPSSLLDALGGALPLPIVASVFGAAAAGQLLVVQRVSGVSASLIGASVADVFHASISTLVRDDPRNVRHAVWRTVWKLALVACAIYVPLGLMSIWGFTLVFGSAWAQAGRLVALFTPLSIVSLAISPVTRIFAVVNRPELKLTFDIGLIAVPVMAFIVLHDRGAGYWSCMIAYVALGTLAYLFYLGLTLWVAGLPPKGSG